MQNNQNIQIETPPEKTRAKSQNLEGKIQASIVKWFGETYPLDRGRFFSYFANPESKLQGGVMLSMGLVKGISDMLYVDSNGFLHGYECKSLGTYHDVSHLKHQAEWLLSIPKTGYFVDSLDMFKDIMTNGGKGISPNRVLKNLKDVKTKTISWNEAKK